VFRRLAIPLHYSNGFHPKPEMVFGPALSLGVASLCEVVDVKIDADVDGEGLLEALTASSQPGLRFVGGVRLDAKAPSVAKVLDAARYVVAVPRSFLSGVGGEAWVNGRLATARATETDLSVTRRIDGVGKRVDVRRFLRSIEVGGPRAYEELARAGTLGDFLALDVDVDVGNAGGVKISEVVEAVFRGDDVPHASVRTALGTRSPEGEVVSPLVVVLPASSASLGEGLATRGGSASTDQP
jgi:radical SAM-linked protein